MNNLKWHKTNIADYSLEKAEMVTNAAKLILTQSDNNVLVGLKTFISLELPMIELLHSIYIRCSEHIRELRKNIFKLADEYNCYILTPLDLWKQIYIGDKLHIDFKFTNKNFPNTIEAYFNYKRYIIINNSKNSFSIKTIKQDKKYYSDIITEEVIEYLFNL